MAERDDPILRALSVRFLVLRRHHVLYEADDRHHNNAPDTAADYISSHAERAADINTQSTQNGLGYLATNAATHNPGYAVTDSA
jgi:hypothetical protein